MNDSPLLLAAVVLRIESPHPGYLKQIGWSLLTVNLLSGTFQVGIWTF